MISISAFSQSKQKAEANFLKELNQILKNTKEYPWANFISQVDTVKIEKPFSISNDVLSLSASYHVNDSIFKVTLEAPVSKIKSILYDHYLVLQFDDEVVTKTEFEPNGNAIKETIKQNYFHIGAPGSEKGPKAQEKLEKLMHKMLKYYNK